MYNPIKKPLRRRHPSTGGIQRNSGTPKRSGKTRRAASGRYSTRKEKVIQMFGRAKKRQVHNQVFGEGYKSGIISALSAFSIFGHELDNSTLKDFFKEVNIADSERAEIMKEAGYVPEDPEDPEDQEDTAKAQDHGDMAEERKEYTVAFMHGVKCLAEDLAAGLPAGSGREALKSILKANYDYTDQDIERLFS